MHGSHDEKLQKPEGYRVQPIDGHALVVRESHFLIPQRVSVVNPGLRRTPPERGRSWERRKIVEARPGIRDFLARLQPVAC